MGCCDDTDSACVFSRALLARSAGCACVARRALGEREVLDYIRQRLRVRPVDFERIEALVEAQFAHLGAGGGTSRPSVDDAYAVLGVGRDATDEQVKRAYRRLMSRHHPDKLVSQGLPEEMVQVATEKSKEISLAYERISRERGL